MIRRNSIISLERPRSYNHPCLHGVRHTLKVVSQRSALVYNRIRHTESSSSWRGHGKVSLPAQPSIPHFPFSEPTLQFPSNAISLVKILPHVKAMRCFGGRLLSVRRCRKGGESLVVTVRSRFCVLTSFLRGTLCVYVDQGLCQLAWAGDQW